MLRVHVRVRARMLVVGLACALVPVTNCMYMHPRFVETLCMTMYIALVYPHMQV